MDLFKNWFSKSAETVPAMPATIEAVASGNDDIDEAMMRRYIQTKRLTLEEWQSPTGRMIIAATESSTAAAVATAVMRERGKALAAVGSDFPPPDPPKPTKTFEQVMKKYARTKIPGLTEEDFAVLAENEDKLESPALQTRVAMWKSGKEYGKRMAAQWRRISRDTPAPPPEPTAHELEVQSVMADLKKRTRRVITEDGGTGVARMAANGAGYALTRAGKEPTESELRQEAEVILGYRKVVANAKDPRLANEAHKAQVKAELHAANDREAVKAVRAAEERNNRGKSSSVHTRGW